MKRRTQKRQRGFHHKRLRVESLEKRMLLAGDVFVSIVDGDLVINGDDADNGVSLTRTDDGAYVISGVECCVDGVLTRTLVNGEDSPATFDALPGHIIVSLGDGDDLFEIDGLIGIMSRQELEVSVSTIEMNYARGTCFDSHITTIHGDLVIDAGSGNDTIELGNIDIEGNLSITMGIGDDEVHYHGVSVPVIPEPDIDPGFWIGPPPEPNYIYYLNRGKLQGNVTIDTGDGNDQVILDDSAIYGEILISTGADDDIVGVYSGSANGLVTIEAGEGADKVGLYHACWFGDDVMISTAGGDDVVLAKMGLGVIRGNLILDTGAGADEVLIEELNSEGNVQIETSDGDDVVNITGLPECFEGITARELATSIHGNVAISTGEGDDKVDISGIYLDGTVQINTAIGDDKVDIHKVDIVGSTSIQTSLGDDTVSFNDVVLKEDLQINTGMQDDNVGFGILRAERNVVVDTAEGVDEIWVGGDVYGDFVLTTGTGDDIIRSNSPRFHGNAILDTGEGNDSVMVTMHGGLQLDTGSGNDEIRLSTRWSNLTIPAFFTSDWVEPGRNYGFQSSPSSFADDVTINAGAGDDSVDILQSSYAGDLTVQLGEGNDTLSLETGCKGGLSPFETGPHEKTRIAGTATLDGGPGTDSLNEDYIELNTAGGWDVRGFENVEDYFLPPEASNVTVEIIDGNLVITGDGTDNNIIIYCVSSRGYRVVVPENPGMPPERSCFSIDLSGQYYDVAGDVVVSLGGGNDYVGLLGGYGNNVTIDMGSGDDVVEYDAAHFEGNLTIIGGSGNDSLGLGILMPIESQIVGHTDQPGDYLSVKGNLILSMDQGDDSVGLYFAKVEGATYVDTDAGNDVVHVGGSLFAGDLTLITGEGADALEISSLETLEPGGSQGNMVPVPTLVKGNLTIDTGEDDDTVTVEGHGQMNDVVPTADGFRVNYYVAPDRATAIAIDGQLVIRTGAGEDHVRVIGTVLNSDVQIETDAGDDDVLLQWVDVAGVTSIDAAAGNDYVRLNDVCLAGPVQVETSAGDDVVVLEIVYAKGSVVLDTDSGTDEVYIRMCDIQGDLDIRTGIGNDTLGCAATTIQGHARWDTGAGNDSIKADVHAGGLEIAAGNGDDEIQVSYPPDALFFQYFGVSFWANPSTGHSPNFTESTFSETAILNAGAGNDEVSIYQSNYAEDLIVLLGAGDDTLVLGTSENSLMPDGGDDAARVAVAGMAMLHGGLGTDSLNEDYLDLNTAGGWDVRGFENVDDLFSQSDDVSETEPVAAPVVGPTPRDSLPGARRTLIDPRGGGESAAVGSDAVTAAARQVLAHDLALAAWNSSLRRQSNQQQDDDDPQERLLLFGCL